MKRFKIDFRKYRRSEKLAKDRSQKCVCNCKIGKRSSVLVIKLPDKECPQESNEFALKMQLSTVKIERIRLTDENFLSSMSVTKAFKTQNSQSTKLLK